MSSKGFSEWTSRQFRNHRGLIAVVAVIAVSVYEWKVKRAHSPEYWWVELILALVVVPAIVIIAASVDDLLTELRQFTQQLHVNSRSADRLAERLQHVSEDLADKSTELLSQGTILNEIYGGTPLSNALKSDQEVRTNFVSFLHSITQAWGDVLTKATTESLSVTHTLKDLPRVTWTKHILPIYAKQEEDDIRNACVATNSSAYLRVLQAVVETVVSQATEAKAAGARIRLRAVTNLLPEEWYNWKDFSPASEQVLRGYGRQLKMLDDYRNQISESVSTLPDDSPVVFERTTLVYAEEVEDKSKSLTNAFNLMGIQPVRRLTRQIQEAKILCEKDGSPWLTDTAGALSYLKDTEEHRSLTEQASLIGDVPVYCVASHPNATLAPGSMAWRYIRDVYTESLHSSPVERNAKYFQFDVASASLRDRLPRIPKDLVPGMDPLLCPDFLSVEFEEAGQSQVCLVIAARFAPNRETILMRFVTDQDECNATMQFLEAIKTRSSPLTDLRE